MGLGANEYYVCLPEAAFDSGYYSDCYTAAYVDSDVLDGVFYFSDAYETGEADYLNRLEPLAQERAQLRYDQLKSEVDGELSDAQREIDDALTEIAEKQQELDDAKAELAESEARLNDAKAELEQGEADYASTRAGMQSRKAPSRRPGPS